MNIAKTLILSAVVLLSVATAHAEFPYPSCAGCPNPNDYQAYLFNPVSSPPTIPSEVGPLDFRVSSLVDPSLPSTPEELFGVAGMSVDLAWQTTTGRPDVKIAILDSGVIYNTDLANKAAPNPGELPLPEGSSVYDANGDGVFNVQDYAGDSRVGDLDGNGLLDPRDLILAFSDGVDDDGDGYTDDICGWDTNEHDNDPFDDVGFGHGTGEARGSVGEVNNGGSWGIAPSAMFVPVRVSDSFIADANDFAAGVLFAVDAGVTIVSEALGTVDNTPFARTSVEYAWTHGVPVIASAADEQSFHHNFPAAYDHVFWANSIRREDGTLVTDPTHLLLNGCTNYGGHAQVAIASSACSSEATERAAGMFALLYSAALNEIDRGNIGPHPVTGTALSPNEALQLLSRTADDIDFSADLALSFDPSLSLIFPSLFSQRFPSHAGFDKYTGYGRANAAAAVARVGAGTIPPEADIATPEWFAVIDPTVSPNVDILGTAAAWRNSNNFNYTVEWACGVDPLEADFAGHQLISTAMSGSAIENGLLAVLDATAVDSACSFSATTLPRSDEDDFDETFTITLRLSVADTVGNTAEARKNIAVVHDPTLRAGFPIDLGTSGESSPVLADLDGDGDQEVVLGTTDGRVHVLQADGSELAGWPVLTNLLPLNTGAPAYQPAALGSDYHAAILGSVAVGDLDGNGTLEVVAADLEGSVYAFGSDGTLRTGFPVTLNPVYSDSAIRNEANRVDFGIAAAPTLADIDGDGDLEILVAAMDRHLYVWNKDGSTVAGFPVLIVDRERMASVDPTTDQVVWKQVAGQNVGSRGTKLIGSPSVGDLDGDGDLEIIVGSNEEYSVEEEANFFIGGLQFSVLSDALDLPNGRLYALSHLGGLDPALEANPSGPFLEGWPVRVGLLLRDLLPTVGHGVNANPVVVDVDDDGDDEVFINGNNGPAYLLNGDGSSYYGNFKGKYLPLNPQTNSGSNPGAGSSDLILTFGILGSGAVGDVDGDASLDFVMPTLGLKQLLDNQAPGLQGPGDQQLAAWAVANGKVAADFPQVMEDLQILTSPAIADLDGDGLMDLVEGSGGYYVHAFHGTGGEVAGWPKFTGGWVLGSAAVGDLDGDGLVDVVAMTREGRLYAWAESGSFASTGPSRVPWATLARDARHTGSLNSGVPTTEAPAQCSTLFRGIVSKAVARFGAGLGDDKVKVKGMVNLLGRSIDPTTETVRVGWGGASGTVYSAEVAAGLITGNSKGTRFKFVDRTLALANGLKKVKIKKKKGLWEFQFQARNVDAELSGDQAFVFFQVGDDCLERLRACQIKGSGKRLKCK